MPAVASTRGVFAMARDRRLPAVFASVSKRYGTPVGAIVLLMVVQAVLIVVAEANDTLFALPGLDHAFSVFAWCATFGAFALIVVYLLMSLGAINGLKDDPHKVELWCSVILGIVVTGAAIFGSFYKVPSPTLLAPMGGGDLGRARPAVHARGQGARASERRVARPAGVGRVPEGGGGAVRPRLVLILSENHTLVPARDLGALVRMAVEAEAAGFDAVMVSEHVVLGPGADAGGVPENPRDYALPGNQEPSTPWPDALTLLRRSRRRRHGSGWSRARSSRRSVTRCCWPSSSRRSTCCPKGAWSSSRR